MCDSCLKALAEQAVEAAAGKSDNVSAIWLRLGASAAHTTPSLSKLLLPVIGAAALILCGAVGLSAFTYMSSEDKVAAADKRAAEALQRAEAAEAKNAEMERRLQEELKAREEAEKKLQELEEAARKEQEEAERRVREKAERLAREEAERRDREEAELRNHQKLNNSAEEQGTPQMEGNKPDKTEKSQESAPPSEAEPSVQAYTPPADSLRDAARHGNVEAVKSLLSVPGCDVNRVDHHMSTPLHLAATYGPRGK